MCIISKSIWSSVRRSKAKVKNIIDSNKWQYFVTLTFSAPEIRENYWAVDDTMRRMARWWRKQGLSYFYSIAGNNDGMGYHVHSLINGDVSGLSAIIADPSIVCVKTKGKSYEWDVLKSQYGVGLHVVQQITCQDDYDRIANYIVGHIADMRLLFTVNNVQERTYHASRGLKMGKSYRYYVGGLKARLYYNRRNTSAVVCQAIASPFTFALQSICDCSYYIGRYGDRMMRAVADFHSIYDLIGSYGVRLP